jgi:hypothetical protein
MSKKTLLIIAIVVIALVGLLIWDKSRPGEYDAFAQCLTDKSAKFWGAFWCPNCQDQKELFGRSDRLLPYVECSTADGRGQLQICRDAGIEAYPTWEFADGSRQTGVLSLENLAERTDCTLN